MKPQKPVVQRTSFELSERTQFLHDNGKLTRADRGENGNRVRAYSAQNKNDR